jgi:hypothetical protein
MHLLSMRLIMSTILDEMHGNARKCTQLASDEARRHGCDSQSLNGNEEKKEVTVKIDFLQHLRFGLG